MSGEVLEAKQPKRDRFGAVLGLLLLAYVLNMLGEGTVVHLVVVATYAGALIGALATARPSRRVRRFAIIAGVVGTVVVLASAAATPVERLLMAADVTMVVLLVVTLVAVLARVVGHTVVGLDTIAGAVAGYLMIGYTFAAVYAVLQQISPEGVFVQVSNPTSETFQYFSFTTLTTLGYGDITAATSRGRAVATLEAVMGQIFLATLVAALVGGFERRRRGGPSTR